MSAPTKKHRNGKRHPMDGQARTVAKRPTIEVIRILNPFSPREHERSELTWRSKRTLAEYFPQIESAELIISVNGKIIEAEEQSRVYLSKGDNVVLCPIPAGGGGKQILAIVAMVAVAVFAPQIALAMNGTMGMTTAGVAAGTLSSTGMMVAAGITMAGGLLVNAIFAPPKATPAAGESSSSYGIDGAKNTSLEAIPVPVCYGKFRTAGNVLGLYTENDSSDSQTLYMLLSAGEGPVASLSDIEINETPISDFKDVEVQTRLGLRNQTPIPWFQDNIVAHNKNQKLTQDWYVTSTDSAVDKVRLDFVAPSGLCELNTKDGKSKNYTVELEVEYRREGTGDWASMPLTNEIVGWTDVKGTFANGVKYDSSSGRSYIVDSAGNIEYQNLSPQLWNDLAGKAITSQEQKQYLANTAPVPVETNNGVVLTSRVPNYVYGISITAAKRSAVRRSFSTGVLEPGRYEIRTRRKTPKTDKENVIDDIYLSDVNEITLDTMSYPHTALVGLKIRMTDQLSGMPNVTFLNGGRLINVYGKPSVGSKEQWYPSASANPAWIVWDILTHRRYGASMPEARLDFRAFVEFAEYSDANKLDFNGPIDSEMNVWDATQLVLRAGHSQLVPSGTRYTVVTEKPAAPVMMFSVANMIEGTYKENWLNLTDRANEIDVTFFDKTDSYKARTVKVYDPAVLTSGAPQRNSAITLYGVVDYERAYKEAQLQLNMNRHILRTVEFSAPLEAIACQVGDLVYVQHDMTEWAVSGRTAAGSTTSVLKLDRDVVMASGKNYNVLLHRDVVKRKEGVITAVVGNSLFLGGFVNDAPVKRLQSAGKEYWVTDTFNGGVIVENAAGLAPNATYSLWDTDVIEEYGVVNVPGTHTEVKTKTPLTSAPGQFITWMFGEAEKVKRPFRIKAIKGSHEYRRDLIAVEYKAEVYEFDRYGSNMPVEPGKNGPIGSVRNLSLFEETYIDGESVVTKVVASWAGPLIGLYGGADVYVKVNDGLEEKLFSVNNRSSAVIPAARGDVLQVRVVSFNLFDRRSKYEEAPVVTYTVRGEVPDLEVGFPSGIGFQWAGRDCKISWRYNSVTHSYEFGSEPTGADAGALDPHFKDYEIRVYDRTKLILRRTEYTTDNSFTYIYDKNFADGLTRHLVFEVRQRDKFNNLGQPATLEASNPPPRVTSASSNATFESATLSYTHDNDPDFAGAMVWVSDRKSDIDPAVPSDAYLKYTGPDTAMNLPGLMFARQYYYRISAFDAFGPTELLPTGVMSFTTTNLNVDAIADGVLAGSKLIPALQSRIDLIDAAADVAGSVNNRLKDVKAEVNNPITGVQAAWAAIGALNDVSATSTSANARALKQLTAVVNSPTTGLPAAMGLIDEINEVSATSDSAAARAIHQVKAQVDDPVTGLAKSHGRITSINDVSATSDSANARQLSTMIAQVNDAKTGLPAAVSMINQLNTVSATSGSTAAKALYQLTSRLDNISPGITLEQGFATSADKTKGLEAQYTVKIDSNGRVSGFGLASTTSAAGETTSEFIINADKFGVIMPSAPGVKPFTIGKVNGVPRVIMSNALIGDASISSAMIGDLQVNSLKIAGEAVTVPIVSTAPNKQRRGRGEDLWDVINEGYINLGQDGMTYILVTGAQGFAKVDDRFWSFRILVDGQVVRSIMGRQANDAIAMSAIVPMAAGAHRIQVSWSAHADVIQGYCDLFMMGVKK
jgi:predicted phage tail protein